MLTVFNYDKNIIRGKIRDQLNHRKDRLFTLPVDQD